MAKKTATIEEDAREVMVAAEFIRLGARMQLLEAEVALSRERLLKLYKEIRGISPPRGMLPFSAEWFMTWQPNVHSSLFAALWHTTKVSEPRHRLITAYQLYLDHIDNLALDPVLSITRAWTLLRFLDAEILQLTRCSCCGAKFVTHAFELEKTFVCVLCHMPSRAATKQAAKHMIGKSQRSIPLKKNRRKADVLV